MTIVVDPRMRRRRSEVRRDLGRRRWRRALWVLVPVLVLVALVGAAHTPLLDVDHVEVEGAVESPESAVIEASRIAPGDPMIRLHEGAAERRVDGLPWVAESDVIRQWPGTVRIVVTERTPVAVLALGDSGLSALVDTSGRVLRIDDAPPDGLATIVEVSATVAEGEQLPADARDALRVAAAAHERLPGALASITPDLVGELRDDESGGGVSVRFGSADELDEKIVALSAILSEVDPACLETVDLQVASAPAGTSAC